MADSSITNLPNSLTSGTIADADPFAVDDTSAAAETKKITWANIKTALQVLFDTLYLPINQSQTSAGGTTYTFVLGDANNLVKFSNAASVTATVPPNSSVAFPVGTQIDLAQRGAGAVTIAAGSGVTVNVNAADTRELDGQYSYATMVKVATNEWDLFGSLVAA
ncbi:MAG: hypothetical protein WBM50_13645 [Acidimicrobiales bacterium]